MKHKCPVCGHEYALGEHTLPGCSECIRNKMVHPDGLSAKHKPATAPPNASYIADGVNAKAIYDYMAGGSHTGPSGCVIFHSPTYNSLNAVSYKPLSQIPGSGDFGSGPFASQFAVWVDLEGKSSQGPHLNFEEESHLHQRVANGDWVPAPKCATCGIVYVWKTGDVCLNCQSSGGT
jgi:hypothetical protein